MTKSEAREALASILRGMAERVEIGGLRYDSKQKQFVFWLYRGDDEIRLVLSDKDIESLKAGDSGEAERAVQAALRQSGS